MRPTSEEAPRAGATANLLQVIPAPAHVVLESGSFTLKEGTPIVFARDNLQTENVANYFARLVARTRGLQLQVRPGLSAGTGAIVLMRDAKFASAEGYELQVGRNRVVIRANDARGLFYGTVTLWQLITAAPPATGEAAIPTARIEDAPRFAWRGLMLDVARHYMPPESIKQILDQMALHKLNTFHWHLTDDQGWRLQIRKYPRLTQEGAYRDQATSGSSPLIHGGSYTHEQVRDIVNYAAERFITVVPEIEMPGHAQAAIAAYPRLGTEGAPPRVSSDWGVHTYLFNVDEQTFSFLEDVLAEVVELFPGPYIHVGGDEAVKDRWRASPRVQQRMRELGIRDETALQSYFVRRMESFLAGRGRKLIGWDEILEGGLPPRATVMSWRGSAGALEASAQGHDVVMAPVPALYMDYLQSDSPDEPPGRPRYVTLADVYGFNVLPEGIDPSRAHHIIGAQVNVWTEHMRLPGRVIHNVFPRLAAFSEVVWSPQRRDWNGFVARLPQQFARYQALHIAAADSAFEVRFALAPLSNRTHVRVELRNQIAHGEIRYQLDGSEPTSASPRYEGALNLEMPVTLSAATFVDGTRVSRPRTREIDAAALLRMSDDELRSCSNKLPLRLEDDSPGDERAVLNVDILDPCWIFPRADLASAAAISVSVARLPFNFQVGKDVEQIPLHPPATPEGELEIRLDSCTGERIAVVPLASVASGEGVQVLPTAPLPAREGVHDLCLTFTRRAVDPMWAIDSVQLIAREGT